MTLTVKDYDETQCECTTCVGMCEKFPCRPLPFEVKSLDARRLMLNYFEGHRGKKIYYLQPAGVGCEMEEADYGDHDYGDLVSLLFRTAPTWRCNFLKEGKCELHGKCKPWEGRVAKCDKENHPQGHKDTKLNIGFPDRQAEILFEAWDTDEGRAVVEAWRKEVDYVG